MITFVTGLCILVVGFIFYSRYVEKQFQPDNRNTPAVENYDGIDFIPLGKRKNFLIQLLNIAGMGPILGGIQGILFGPVAFILIPLGCIFMGGVQDYFSGMISVRNNGMQVTGMIQKYLGNGAFKFFIIIVTIMLLLLTSVFVYTAGDVMAERFFAQKDFSLTNPIILCIYGVVILYYIFATMFPIDKIIGKIYPFFGALLLLGTLVIFIGFFVHGIQLTELDFRHLNLNPQNFPLIPFFFMTVSCGLLSGFHVTQSTIISRTLKSEFDGRIVFYGMMCLEALIAMIWAAGAMHVYSNNLVPQNLIGTANVANIITDHFVPLWLTFIVTIAIVILPITSGDTALRSVRMIIADALKISQKSIKNRLIIIVPITIIMVGIVCWSKLHYDSFGLIWRYFTVFNQLIAIPAFICATVFLYNAKKNFIITIWPSLFYVFVIALFIFHAKIGFNLPINVSQILAWVAVFVILIRIIILCKKYKSQD